MTSRTVLARVGERIAARHLERQGLEVAHRNWRCATPELRGELDLVLRGVDLLVVCEVKARRGEQTGGALAAVTAAKQAQLRRLTAAYLAQERPAVRHVRIDVVGVTWPAGGGGPLVEHVTGVC